MILERRLGLYDTKMLEHMKGDTCSPLSEQPISVENVVQGDTGIKNEHRCHFALGDILRPSHYKLQIRSISSNENQFRSSRQTHLSFSHKNLSRPSNGNTACAVRTLLSAGSSRLAMEERWRALTSLCEKSSSASCRQRQRDGLACAGS